MARQEGSVSAVLFGTDESGNGNNAIRPVSKGGGGGGEMVAQLRAGLAEYVRTVARAETQSFLVPVGRAIPIGIRVTLKPLRVEVTDTLIPDMKGRRWALMEDGSVGAVRTDRSVGPNPSQRLARQVAGVYREYRDMMKDPIALADLGWGLLGERGQQRVLQASRMASLATGPEDLRPQEVVEATKMAVGVSLDDDGVVEAWVNQMGGKYLETPLMDVGEIVLRHRVMRRLKDALPVLDDSRRLPIVNPKDDFSSETERTIPLFRQSGSTCVRAMLMGAGGFNPLMVSGDGIGLALNPDTGRVVCQLGLESDDLVSGVQSLQVDTQVADGPESLGRVLKQQTRVQVRVLGRRVGLDSRRSIAKRAGGRLPADLEGNKPPKEEGGLVGWIRTWRLTKEERLQKKQDKERRREDEESRLAQDAYERLALPGTLIIRGDLVTGRQGTVTIPVVDVPTAVAGFQNVVWAWQTARELWDASKEYLEQALGPGAARMSEDALRQQVVDICTSRVIVATPRTAVVVGEARRMQQRAAEAEDVELLRALGTDPKKWSDAQKAYYRNPNNEEVLRQGVAQKLELGPEDVGVVDRCIQVLREKSR